MEARNNPFNIGFGEEPQELIKRTDEFEDIINNFDSDNPTSKALIITGPRGLGKTILLFAHFLRQSFSSWRRMIELFLEKATTSLANSCDLF